MINRGRTNRHHSHTVQNALVDCALFLGGFGAATFIRFGTMDSLSVYLPGVIAGMLSFVVAAHIAGLYAINVVGNGSVPRHLFRVFLCAGLATIVMIAIFYLNFSTRVGRGVMAMAWPMTALGLVLHHLALRWLEGNQRERVAFVVLGREEEPFLKFFQALPQHRLEFLGVISDLPDFLHGFKVGSAPHLGGIDSIEDLVSKHRIHRVVISGSPSHSAERLKLVHQLRYRGVEVSPLVNFCEEFYQFVPLRLVSLHWLLDASNAPYAFYIRKAKRLMDLGAFAALVVFLLPVLVLGMFLVRLTSRGPVFYTQERVGQFGKRFRLIKLRTMATDAEKDGPVWAGGARDGRLTPLGKYLRRYRIDEIPQLWNIARGEMSFVGPRPERPEFVGRLKDDISDFGERLMVKPGLTGWAQVKYPYGSSTEDARHKLEYDLFYVKHMNLFFDLLILFDTVRIVLVGGLREDRKRLGKPWLSASSEISRLLVEQENRGRSPGMKDLVAVEVP